MAIRQSLASDEFVDPTEPAKLFLKGCESLATASSPEKASSIVKVLLRRRLSGYYFSERVA